MILWGAGFALYRYLMTAGSPVGATLPVIARHPRSDRGGAHGLPCGEEHKGGCGRRGTAGGRRAAKPR
ncbi:hypothetical protein, partial [Cloacibacillus evryensis]|uniref:hypothetical protein n=1 Tax=Cloacibacillus evryensis TaxID=508460 RepID=UPI00210C8377